MKWNPVYTWSSSTAFMTALMAILLIWPETEGKTLVAIGSVTIQPIQPEPIPVPDKPKEPNEESNKKAENKSSPDNHGRGAGGGNKGGGDGTETNPGGNVIYPPIGPNDKTQVEAADPSGKRTHFLTLSTNTDEVEKGQSFDYHLKTLDEILIESLKSEFFKNKETNGAKVDVTVTGKGKDFNIHVETKTGGKLYLEIEEGTLLASPSGKTYKIGKCKHFGNPVEVWEPIVLTTKVDKLMVQLGEKVVYDIGMEPKAESFNLDQENFRNNQNTPVTFSGFKPIRTGWQMEATAMEPGKIQLAMNKPFEGRSAEGVKLKTKGPFVDKKEVEVQLARFEIKGKMLLVIADTQFFRVNGPRFKDLMELAKGVLPDPILLLKANGKLVPWDGTPPMGESTWAPEDLAKCWTSLPQALKGQTKQPSVGSFLLWPESSNQDNTKLNKEGKQASKRLLGLIGNPNGVSEGLAKELPVGDLLDLRTEWKAMLGSIELQLVK